LHKIKTNYIIQEQIKIPKEGSLVLHKIKISNAAYAMKALHIKYNTRTNKNTKTRKPCFTQDKISRAAYAGKPCT
jgi:hypothetical protein